MNSEDGQLTTACSRCVKTTPRHLTEFTAVPRWCILVTLVNQELCSPKLPVALPKTRVGAREMYSMRGPAGFNRSSEIRMLSAIGARRHNPMRRSTSEMRSQGLLRDFACTAHSTRVMLNRCCGNVVDLHTDC